MADYINREELLKEEQIFQQYNSAIKDDEYIRAVTVADIEAQPSIDAVEQKHGHWKKALPFYYDCSVCGHNLIELLGQYSELYYDICSVAKYCPFCGAKMRGDNDGN